MKKFVAGVIVGALLFGAIPVFADSISLIGAKVTGVFAVEKNGKKIADAAVINGSTYVPVRVMAEATGTPLNVEGKKITLGLKDSSTDPIAELTAKRGKLDNELSSTKTDLNIAETVFLPDLQKELEKAEADPVLSTFPGTVDILKQKIEEQKTLIEGYKKRIPELEAELEKLK